MPFIVQHSGGGNGHIALCRCKQDETSQVSNMQKLTDHGLCIVLMLLSEVSLLVARQKQGGQHWCVHTAGQLLKTIILRRVTAGIKLERKGEREREREVGGRGCQ